jgi:hypothetical protein
MAAYEGQTNMVVYLTGTKYGCASWDITNGMGWTPLWYAIHHAFEAIHDNALLTKRLSMVSCLISRGADVKGSNPIGKHLVNYTMPHPIFERTLIQGWLLRRNGFTPLVSTLISEYYGYRSPELNSRQRMEKELADKLLQLKKYPKKYSKKSRGRWDAANRIYVRVEDSSSQRIELEKQIAILEAKLQKKH